MDLFFQKTDFFSKKRICFPKNAFFFFSLVFLLFPPAMSPHTGNPRQWNVVWYCIVWYGMVWVPGQLVQRHLVQRHLVQDAWYKDKRSKQTLGPKDTSYKGQKVQRQMVQSDTWYNRQKVQCFVKPDKRSKRQKVLSDKMFKIYSVFFWCSGLLGWWPFGVVAFWGILLCWWPFGVVAF